MVCSVRDPTLKDYILESLDIIEVALFGTEKSRGPLQIEGIAAERNAAVAFDKEKEKVFRGRLLDTERMLNSSLIDSLDDLRSLMKSRKRVVDQTYEDERESCIYFHNLRRDLNLSLGGAADVFRDAGLHHYVTAFEGIRKGTTDLLNGLQKMITLPRYSTQNN